MYFVSECVIYFSKGNKPSHHKSILHPLTLRRTSGDVDNATLSLTGWTPMQRAETTLYRNSNWYSSQSYLTLCVCVCVCVCTLLISATDWWNPLCSGVRRGGGGGGLKFRPVYRLSLLRFLLEFLGPFRKTPGLYFSWAKIKSHRRRQL
jgi:hypothetical protein